ncbi:MAG: cation diffusion facilitator family transporter [Nocardioidaceae bacterium]|nr:cation diffusion facilitator family transporter [Nocardioidaceae bacterium]
MGYGHGHGQGSSGAVGHAGGRHRWRLIVSFVLIGTFFLIEFGAGILSGSLALISDAGHMAADVVTLGAALVATKVATRADHTGRRTYGSYRAEVFASGLAVLMMLGVSVYVVLEAISRIGAAPDVATGPMLVVGLLGLLVNVAVMALLRAGAQESLNVKGAYVEVIADAAGSVGVMVAGGLILLTGQGVWDSVAAFAIGAFVAVRAVLLGREVLAVLGQHVPAGMDIDAVAAALAAVPGVCDVHDLHAWTLTSGMNVATAHLVLEAGTSAEDTLRLGQRLLREEFAIEHATLQVEGHRSTACDAVDW